MARARKATSPSEADPYGNEGVTPDPQWSSIWAAWSYERKEAYLQAFRHQKQALSFDQIIDVLQDLPPRPPGWGRAAACLTEYSAAVDRFRFDVGQCLSPPSLKWEELRDWCHARSVALPELLIQVLGPDEASQRTTTPIPTEKLAPWIPSQAIASTVKKKPQGRRP